MNVNALRTWGIAVSAALMAVALAISLQHAPTRRASAQPLAQAQPQTLAEADDARASFVVRFRGSGPIARAQARAARGDIDRAEREVAAELQRQRAFAGLCFDRFTAGGAEIVLQTCEPIAAAQFASVQQTWLRRLRAMRAIDYADANVVAAAPEAAPS